jgi:hypothetical protein
VGVGERKNVYEKLKKCMRGVGRGVRGGGGARETGMRESEIMYLFTILRENPSIDNEAGWPRVGNSKWFAPNEICNSVKVVIL